LPDHVETKLEDAQSIGGSMWLLVTREPRPDATDWPGRHLLAGIDALVWPLLWALVISHAPAPVGLAGPFVAALACLCALARLHRALWTNHRYRFTTWRWGRVAAVLVLMGLMLKLATST
jgi:hypothetical protein